MTDDAVPPSELIEVEVYRSPAWPDAYIYLPADEAIDTLPDAILAKFKAPESFLRFELSPERELAQAEAPAVLDALERQGFYLQLPPSAHPLDVELGSG